MRTLTEMNLTLEEIYLVCQCRATGQKEIISELQNYLETAEPDMAELIARTIKKAGLLTQEEMKIVKSYPVDDFIED